MVVFVALTRSQVQNKIVIAFDEGDDGGYLQDFSDTLQSTYLPIGITRILLGINILQAISPARDLRQSCALQ